MENGTAIVEKFGNLEMDSGLVITGIKEQEQVEGSGCGYKKAPGDTFVVMKCSVFWLYQRQYPGCDTEIQLLQNITIGGNWCMGSLLYEVVYEDTSISNFFKNLVEQKSL